MQLPRSISLEKNLSRSKFFRGFEFGRTFFSTVLFAAILIAAAVSEAAEHEAAAPAAAEHEAAPAGEHGAAGGAKASALKVKPPCRFSEHESRLTSNMAKIRTYEKEISDMIASKHHMENSEKIRVLTQQISFKHSDLAKVVREYEDERLHVRFQHPDRDMEADRKYTAQHLKSIDEIEEAFGLDGRLDRIRKQVTTVFPASEKVDGVSLRKPASSPSEDADEIPAGIHLVK